MIGLGCSLQAPALHAGLVPALPAASAFADLYAGLGGVVSGYIHPAGGLLPEPVGRLQALSGWVVQAGAPVVEPGRIAFPPSAVTQFLRHDLSASPPVGTRLRIQWLQHGTGGIRLRLGEGASAPGIYRQGAGWQSVDLEVLAPGNRLVVQAQAGNIDAAVSHVSVTPIDAAAPHDIVLLIGGGNMTGERAGQAPDPAFDVPHPLVDVLAAGAVAGGADPVQHRQRSAGLGPAMAFARAYADNLLPDGRRLLLVPAGRADAALSDPMDPSGATAPWHPGNGLSGMADLYASALADAQAALAMNPGQNRVVLVWWSGGEADAGASFFASAYQAALRDEVIPGLRAALGVPDLPVAISGGNPAALPPPWLDAEAVLDQDSGAVEALAGVFHAAWNPAWGPGTRPDPVDPVDALHFSGSANRVRGVQMARMLTERLFTLLRLRRIAAPDVIGTGTLLDVAL